MLALRTCHHVCVPVVNMCECNLFTCMCAARIYLYTHGRAGLCVQNNYVYILLKIVLTHTHKDTETQRDRQIGRQKDSEVDCSFVLLHHNLAFQYVAESIFLCKRLIPDTRIRVCLFN